MNLLNPATVRRLNQLPQMPTVWEGDRRALSGTDLDGSTSGECIVWVDSMEGVVRAMEVVSPDIGPEAVVRALLRAIEYPQSPAKPARPQKIVVRDREIQFYLRGVLQDLDIAIEYVPELILIDELFRGFQDMASARPPMLPPQYTEGLMRKAYKILETAPWEIIAEHEIVSIELNRWDIGTLYVSIMGMFGSEYGLLLYRSLDSLKRFRAAALGEKSYEEMEEIFLSQDCLFVTFERMGDMFEDEDDDDDIDIDIADLPVSEIDPHFGTIHPLEGMRPFLYDEEALGLDVAIDALLKFIKSYGRRLAGSFMPSIEKKYKISLPEETRSKETAPVTVATMPELSEELLEMSELAAKQREEELDEVSLPLQNDLIPHDAFIRLDRLSREQLESLKSSVNCYQSQDLPQAAAAGLPVVMIQTTRPKAKKIIEEIQDAGGLRGICFSPGEDPFIDETYDLGILQTEDGQMYLFGEFMTDDPDRVADRKKWDKECEANQGYCGLIIAKGLTGASGGDPKPGDTIAVFETRSLSPKDLGLGILQAVPFDF